MKDKTKYGVIDVGSNSVRAILYSDGKILYKGLITSRLGEGLYKTGNLTSEAIDRTVKAIKTLFTELVVRGAEEILPFATEAVRSAKNSFYFLDEVKKVTGLTIDVVSGDEEGELGLLGALKSSNGGIIDIGGASAEIVVAKDGKIVYSHSLPLGAVRLHDACGENQILLEKAVSERIEEYGNFPNDVVFYAIGGTATTLGFVDSESSTYNEELVDGRVLTAEKIDFLYNKIKNLNKSERIEKLGINPKRAEIIVGGVYLLKRITEKFNIGSVVISEGDNMLGYIKKKVFGECYEK